MDINKQIRWISLAHTDTSECELMHVHATLHYWVGLFIFICAYVYTN